ncbi:MAG: helix-turn-helix transcriptional regulator [Oribacterium sp.]|nr:helix-turn-helix transcriptional regulator [Oribacterium sp.]MBQ5330377.1 helix-turn-helix transcriptional regulator [Oscillospiraceae bacterium]
MSRIIFEDNYVIVSPTFEDVSEHKHSFCHVFFLFEGDSCKHLRAVGSNVLHTMPPLRECRLFLMIDPTAAAAEQLMKYEKTETVQCDPPLAYSDSMSDNEVRTRVRLWMDSVFPCVKKSCDERIAQLVTRIGEYRYLEKSVPDIARSLYLSESRLSHMFRESMGISLKGYLGLKQIQYAYELIRNGSSITTAALESGFSSSAHLAASCKKMMGISISNVIK